MRDERDALHQRLRIGRTRHIEAHHHRIREGALEKVTKTGFVIKDRDDFTRKAEMFDNGGFVLCIGDGKAWLEDNACIDRTDGETVALQRLDRAKQHIRRIASCEVGGDGTRFVGAVDKFNSAFCGEIIKQVMVCKEALKPEILDIRLGSFVVNPDAEKGFADAVKDITRCKLFDAIQHTRMIKGVLVGVLLEDAQGAGGVIVERTVEIEDDEGIAPMFERSLDLVEDGREDRGHEYAFVWWTKRAYRYRARRGFFYATFLRESWLGCKACSCLRSLGFLCVARPMHRIAPLLIFISWSCFSL